MFSTRVKINKIIIKLGRGEKAYPRRARFIRFINVTGRGNERIQTTNNSLFINSSLKNL